MAVKEMLPGFTKYDKGNLAKPSGLVLHDKDGVEWYLWVDTTGDVRIVLAATAEVSTFNWLTGGAVVGGQTA